MKCPFCGSELRETRKFCTGCGRRVDDAQQGAQAPPPPARPGPEAPAAPPAPKVKAARAKKKKEKRAGRAGARRKVDFRRVAASAARITAAVLVVLVGATLVASWRFHTRLPSVSRLAGLFSGGGDAGDCGAALAEYRTRNRELTVENEALARRVEEAEFRLNQYNVALEKYGRSRAVGGMIVGNSSEFKSKYYHYEFVGTWYDEETTGRFDKLYETMRGFFESEFGFERLEGMPLIPVRIFKSDADFRKYLKTYGWNDMQSQGMYIPWRDEIVYSADGISDHRLASGLVHETVHYLVDHHIRHSPLWLNEGLAEYCDTAVRDDFEVKFGTTNAWSVDTVQRALVSGTNIPFRDFVRIGHDQFTKINYGNEAFRTAGYAQSWFMVSMFMESTEDNKRIFREYMRHLLGGGGKTIDAFLGEKKFAELEEDWNGFLKSM